MSKKTEIEPVKQELSTSVQMDFMADAGMGMEQADASTYAITFLTILQGLSPQIETVDGARPGMILNTITDEIYKEVEVIPCSYQRKYLRWAPRSEGGGYKGEHSPIDVETGKLAGVTQNDKGGYQIGNDELKDTRNHFVLVKSATGAWQPALLSLGSTQIKKSKRWMSRINGIEMRSEAGKPFTPPSFSHIYKLSTVKEENSKGAWWGLEVELVGLVQDVDTYAKARDFSKQVQAGQVNVSEPGADAQHEEKRGF